MANELNIEGLQKEILADIEALVRGRVKDACENIMKKIITKNVYNRMTNSSGAYYTRTYDFVNAVEVSDITRSGNTVRFTVGINAGKLRPSSGGRGELAQHQSEVTGNSFQEGLIVTIDEGSSGSPIYNWKATHFMDDTFNELDEQIISELVSGLKGYGWDAYIR